jgi:hypothetical protein
MKTRTVLSLFLLLPLSLAACGGARSVAPPREAPAMTEAPAAQEVPLLPASAATAAPAEGAKPQSAELALPNPSSGRMIIKDALMDLLVADPELAIERVTSLAADQGGYLVSSRAWMENGFKNAELRMGVPSSHFEDTLTQLRRMAVQVLNEQTSGQDVSADYADLAARLVNLEATAARVRAFLEQAKTVEESLKINGTLSDLEGQIEQVKGQMKFYEGRSAYSTITVLVRPQLPTPTVTLTPTTTPTPTATPGWNPGKTVSSASTVMVKLIQGSLDLLIWMVFLLWPFVLIVLVVWWVIRRLRRKPGKPKPEPKADDTP